MRALLLTFFFFLFFFAYRLCVLLSIYYELVDNEQWYRAETSIGKSIDHGEADDRAWKRDFEKLLSEALPSRGVAVGPEKYLGDIHILALANLLRRPILLLDHLEEMVQFPCAEGKSIGLILYHHYNIFLL